MTITLQGAHVKASHSTTLQAFYIDLTRRIAWPTDLPVPPDSIAPAQWILKAEEPSGVFEHHKGGTYLARGAVLAPYAGRGGVDEVLVLYQGLPEDGSPYWLRPYAEWNELVPRFKLKSRPGLDPR